MPTSQVPQVAAAKKAAALKAKNKSPKLSAKLRKASTAVAFAQALKPDDKHHQHDRERVYAPRAPRAPPVRLLGKPEVLCITGVTFPTVWKWMRTGQFPRARIIGQGPSSKSVWRSDEVERWLARLPTRALKGDKLA
jgi:predicted DNA-binding transcriptional regulator AlpA